MFSQDRPDRTGSDSRYLSRSQRHGTVEQGMVERIAGASSKARRFLRGRELPSRETLLRSGSVVVASSALAMAILVQPLAGATPALAADADPGVVQNRQPDWVQNSQPIPLWSDSRESKKRLVIVPPESKLRVLSNAQDGRWRVHYDENVPGGQSYEGWVNQKDTQAVAPAAPDQQQAQPAAPASQPQQPPVADKGGPTPDISTPKKFIAAVVPAAQDSERETGAPTSVTIAQAILESEWGRSGLSKKAQNYFGIKATSSPGPAGVVNMDTWEVFGGVNTVIRDGFKAYHNLYESVMDHGRFLRQNSRYANAFTTSDPVEFARRMHQAGYATDPAYAGKISSLIDQYGLRQYDLKK